MTSRNSSFSGRSTSQTQIHTRRPSVTSRLSFAISHAEQGDGANAQHATGIAAKIDEEIEEIKRYEVRHSLEISLREAD